MNANYSEDINTNQLNSETNKLIRQFQEWHKLRHAKKEAATIHVDEVASAVARFYEKIRMVVDWKEEHLIRRIAVQRILKRRLLMNYSNSPDLAEIFVKELIRGGHFPNDTIPKSKIKRVQKIIEKYNSFIKNAPGLPKGKNKSQFFTMLAEVAACEIEATLDPAAYLRADAMMDYMEATMRKKIIIGSRAQRKTNINEQTKKIQIYIAVQQALMKLDKPIIIYNLLRRYFNDWSYLSPERLQLITKNIHRIISNIEDHLKYPLSDKFYKICKQYTTPYLLMGDILNDYVTDMDIKLTYSQLLKELVKKVYKVRHRTLKRRIRRAAIYATLSVFFTNVASMYLLEIPVALYLFDRRFNMLGMVVDVFGPTLLMTIIVATIRLPGEKNFLRVFEEVKKIVYQKEIQDIYEVELYPKEKRVFRFIFSFFYVVSFLTVFGLISWIFYLSNFPPFSYLINLVFSSLIAFTGTILRQRARELYVTEEIGRFFHIIIEPLSIPIIRVGKWISARWEKINIVSVFFSLLIDMPFMIFAEFIEQWRYFLKEKKEDIR